MPKLVQAVQWATDRVPPRLRTAISAVAAAIKGWTGALNKEKSMRRRLPAGVSIAALCLCLFALRGEAADGAAKASARKSADLRSALVGTWRVTSMKIDGEAQDLPASMITSRCGNSGKA